MLKHKIISTILFVILFFVSASECNAGFNNKVITLATQALEVTSGFDKPIIGGDIKRAEELYRGYYEIYENLQKFLQNPPKNIWNEECDCISFAGSIVNLRRLVLMDYIIAVEAYQNNQIEQYNQMMNIMYEEWNNANYNTYGF